VCKETASSFIADGYVPTDKAQEVISELRRVSGEKVIIEEKKLGSHDPAPVALKNPARVKDFQFFLDLYSLPRYKEIDPTWILFITFPIFFGFMLGDIGYGIASLALFWLLKWRMPQFGRFFNILMISSVSSMIFGSLFAEFFGLELYHPVLNRNPAHELEPLMLTAIAIGMLHINFGLTLGFINAMKAHGFKEAFFEKAGWFLLQISAAVLALSYLRMIPVSPILGYVLLAVSIYIIYKGEGIAGIVELPGIFGNILSYARLMAIGLSSVGIALVVNDMAVPFLQKGGLSIITGFLILLTGHVLNISIGCLGAFLHSLRLHYVELFGKFYKGGGVPFNPFGEVKQNG